MVYLDHNATTPLDERVVAAMLPFLNRFHGNPSAIYRAGRLARAAVDAAREQVAALVAAPPAWVVFTSGGTEANNLALKGCISAGPPGTLVAGATEHPSVTEPIEFLEKRGWTVAKFPVDACGRPELALLEEIPAGTLRLTTHLLANNETGVIHELGGIAELTRRQGGWFHVDAVQAAGKIPVDIAAIGAHSMSLSAHKIYGPKGVGALILEPSVPITPLLHGGGQERGLRAGTENVAAIVGFGRAAELALSELEDRTNRLMRLRRHLEAGLESIPGVTLFAAAAERLPNTVQFALPGYDGEALVMNLDRMGFAVSSGSACASGGGEPSPVLLAMGVDRETAKRAVRVSLGNDNDESQIDRLLAALRTLSN